jgi:hypothetical protein
MEMSVSAASRRLRRLRISTVVPRRLDLTSSASYSSTFLAAHGGTAAGGEAALASALANGQAYVDIHTSVYPGGEIRVFLIANELFANGFDGN